MLDLVAGEAVYDGTQKHTAPKVIIVYKHGQAAMVDQKHSSHSRAIDKTGVR